MAAKAIMRLVKIVPVLLITVATSAIRAVTALRIAPCVQMVSADANPDIISTEPDTAVRMTFLQEHRILVATISNLKTPGLNIPGVCFYNLFFCQEISQTRDDIFDSLHPSCIAFEIFFNKKLLIRTHFDGSERHLNKRKQFLRFGKRIITKGN